MHDYLPKREELFGLIPDRFHHSHVIVKPDKDEPEWWAGAPSVVRDTNGVFWMACRMRTAHAPRGLRGYEIRILRSEDGLHFEKTHAIQREDIPIPGFERPSLLIDPNSGLFKLYGCAPWDENRWCIFRFDDAASPPEFSAVSARIVLEPAPPAFERDVCVSGYKDPVLFHDGEDFHCFTIGIMRQTERVYHFKSNDGETWNPVGSPYDSIMTLNGWHDFYVRPASVLPLGIGYLFVYEGSNVNWYDPVYNICTGLAFTFDLHRILDLTPESPLLLSPSPSPQFATFRYSSWLWVGQQIWIYAEVACPNESNETRLYRIDMK